MRFEVGPLLLSLGLAGAVACGSPDEPKEPATTAPDELRVTSPAFAAGKPIPSRYSCDGDNTSPPLSWRGVPADTSALALVMDDPDAPGGTFVHWVVMDMPASARALRPSQVPAGSVQAENSGGETGYFGPCPPSGTHHYRFTVYALDSPTDLSEGADLDAALDAIDRRATSRGRLVALYARGD